MKCPICKERMRLASEDESSNPRTGTKYKRKIYVCDKDNAWLTVELPKAK